MTTFPTACPAWTGATIGFGTSVVTEIEFSHPPGLLAYQYQVFLFQMPIAKGVKGHIESKKLDEAGRRHPYLRILLKKKLTRNGIHQNSGLSADTEALFSPLRKSAV